MIAFALAELAEPLAGTCNHGDVHFSSVSTDTRTLGEGDLFVALRGPNFDGHDYARMAADRGASALLVEYGVDLRLPQLRVPDTLVALGHLSRIWRQRSAVRLAAVTGSNGKTTLKAMLAAILGRLGPVMATRGNLNNQIGVPLTLTRLQDEQFAVVELGANHPGEISYLSNLALPDVAVLNNAGRAHLEGFGSPEGVARAKAEILHGLSRNGTFVYNNDDPFARLWRELAGARRTLTFGVRTAADVSSPIEGQEMVWDEHGFRQRFAVRSPLGDFDVTLQLAGEHNRMNALAGAAAALAFGADEDAIARGLAEVAPVPGRLSPVSGPSGARVVDDSYNANPDSVRAAIGVLASAPGRRTLVLGDLAELGSSAQDMHANLGKLAQQTGIERLYSCGELSAAASAAFGRAGRHFTEQERLIDALLADLDAEDSVLVKGSRTARMDRIVTALVSEATLC